MTAPAPSAPISTSRLAHARAPGARLPACRACTRARGRAPLRVGEGRRRRGRRRREQRTALSRDPKRPPDPRWALQDPAIRQRPESSGSPAGRVSTISRRRRRASGWEGKGEGRDPRSRPSPPREGAERRGRRACSGPSPGEPARRSRAPALRGVGEGDARAKEGGRAGAAIASSPAPSHVRGGWGRGGPKAGGSRKRVSPTQ